MKIKMNKTWICIIALLWSVSSVIADSELLLVNIYLDLSRKIDVKRVYGKCYIIDKQDSHVVKTHNILGYYNKINIVKTSEEEISSLQLISDSIYISKGEDISLIFDLFMTFDNVPEYCYDSILFVWQSNYQKKLDKFNIDYCYSNDSLNITVNFNLDSMRIRYKKEYDEY